MSNSEVDRSIYSARSHTIGQLYDAGQTAGFDYLRIFLSVAVLCIHSFAVSYGKEGENFLFAPPLRGIITMVLPAFFALSGFLVCGSLVRTPNIVKFLTLRVIRLVPALGVEVILCAVVLGSIFTTLPLSDYFRHGEFRSYFSNIIGHIQFLLPGVFRDNPFFQAVNVSLWTVPYELECYLALTVLAVFGLLRRKAFLLAAVSVALVGIFVRDFLRGGAELPVDGSLPGRILVLSFLAGVVLFVYRDHVIISGRHTLAALVVSFVMLNLPYAPYFAVPVIGYATVGAGLSNVKSNSLLLSGDYSYGIYLYAFPIQQTIAHLFPMLREWYFNIALALPITCLFAAFSWHAVEKHALKLKRFVRR